jgi:hypothetical protein
MAEINPHGEEGVPTPMTPTDQPVPAVGITGTQGSKPAPPEPHTMTNPPPGPRPVTPASWTDGQRIIRTIMALYTESPTLAEEVRAFAQEKLDKIRAGK